MRGKWLLLGAILSWLAATPTTANGPSCPTSQYIVSFEENSAALDAVDDVWLVELAARARPPCEVAAVSLITNSGALAEARLAAARAGLIAHGFNSARIAPRPFSDEQRGTWPELFEDPNSLVILVEFVDDSSG